MRDVLIGQKSTMHSGAGKSCDQIVNSLAEKCKVDIRTCQTEFEVKGKMKHL